MKDFDSEKMASEFDLLIAIAKLKGLSEEEFISNINKKWENKND